MSIYFQLRKTLNDEQNSKIVSHNQKLVKRKEEIAMLDAKIALLQNRLRVSKLQKQNERNGHSFGTVVATAIESCNHTDVRSTVPSDGLKPPSKVESRYQSLPPGKTPPFTSAIKAASGYEKENGFARADRVVELEENGEVTGLSKRSQFDFIFRPVVALITKLSKFYEHGFMKMIL